MLDLEILKGEFRRKLSLYRYCLNHWRDDCQDLGSALTFRAETIRLLQQLSLHFDKATWERFREQLQALDLEREQLLKADRRAYVASLRQELAADLRIIEADLDFLSRLVYEEALRLWVTVETVGYILDELNRVDAPVRHARDWAHYKALWQRLEERLLELPEDAEMRKARPPLLLPPPLPLT
ncbi:MAG: hypothetical protein CVU38_03590 [Chloroflexi bacterium HGW-Chloroflexi-1]|nr:MAG: hypothetical protein CVU38_03590 [Chloroflexi bacterium HGW-Chloroflexi-1]